MWIAGATTLAGLIQLGTWEFAPSVQALLGTTGVVMWCVYMVLGGLIVVYGYSFHRPSYEILGLVWLGIAQIVYTVALISLGGIPLLIAALSNLAVAVAHFMRARHLRTTSRRREWIRRQSAS